MMRVIFLVSLALLCGARPDDDSVAVQEFVSGNHLFCAAIYKELVKSNSGNLIVSPLSAETVLALTQEGAKGATSEEMLTGLHLPNTKEKTQAAIKSLLPHFKKNTDQIKLLSANKVYVADGFNINDEFKKTAVDVYNSEVDNLNFAEKQKSADTINTWVEDHTNKKIQKLISPDNLGGGVRVVLVNALYFSGKWVTEFETHLTNKEKFYKNNANTVDVDMMHVTDSFNYYEDKDLKAKFLELPYLGGDVSMTIVLPDDKEGLGALEKNVEKVFNTPKYTTERVAVSLPRFTIESSIKFVPILKSLGIKKAFDAKEADFSGIGEKGLFISDVIQKAFINVTESGTEAAAATAGFVALLSAPINHPVAQHFKADHPFTYYLKNTSSGEILFAGRYNSL